MLEPDSKLSMEDVMNGTIEEKMLAVQRDNLINDVKKGNLGLALTHLKSLRRRIGSFTSEPTFMPKIRQANLIETFAELFQGFPRAKKAEMQIYEELAWCFSNLTTAENYEVGFVLNSSFIGAVFQALELLIQNCNNLSVLRHVSFTLSSC